MRVHVPLVRHFPRHRVQGISLHPLGGMNLSPALLARSAWPVDNLGFVTIYLDPLNKRL